MKWRTELAVSLSVNVRNNGGREAVVGKESASSSNASDSYVRQLCIFFCNPILT